MHHKKQLAYLTLNHDDGLCNMQNEDQLDCQARLPWDFVLSLMK